MQEAFFDVAVVGGGMAGYYAALEAAKQGLNTALIEPRGFLGHELTATGHNWIRNGSSPYEVFQAVGSRKKLMLRELVDQGVTVLLMSTPVGLALSGQRVIGVLIANKFGLQSLLAGTVIDTTDDARSFKQWGKIVKQTQDDVKAGYTITLSNMRTQYETSLSIPEHFGLEKNQVSLHPSILPNTVSIEFRYALPCPITAVKRGAWERQARLKALSVFEWLHENIPPYRQATLQDLAGEIRLEQKAQTQSVQGMIHFPFCPGEEISTDDLHVCHEQAAKWVKNLPQPVSIDRSGLCFMLHEQIIPHREEALTKGLPKGLKPITLLPKEGQLPALNSAAAVAGAGSAGTLCALALMKENTQTIVINTHNDPGGTRTVGRVSGNYHGFIGGISARLNEETALLSQSIGGHTKEKDRIARILLYHRYLNNPLCTYLSGHTVCGVRMDGNRVKALWAAGEDGLYEICADTFIDATSDADVAVFAGADYDVGCPLDSSVMTIGQWGDTAWQLEKWTDAPYRTDLDVLFPDRYDEYLRLILLAHGRNSDIDFAPYPNLRESRRIHCEHTLTLSDVLLNRPFDDIVSVASTPYDTHGVASSVLLRMGMLEFNENPLNVRLPLRVFVPKGIKGLLVGGKAAGATRDASSLFRMNADVENAGYALGLITARSVALKIDPLNVPLAPIQNELQLRFFTDFCVNGNQVEGMDRN